MAFLKSADTRREASFAVRPGETISSVSDLEARREAKESARQAQKERRSRERAEKRGKGGSAQ